MIKKYVDLVEKSVASVKSILPREEVGQLQNKATQLVKEIENEQFIKVPFVGDFSAGKSTLLNTLIGRKGLLPTDIAPTTAVSYELYYSVNEHIEQYEGSKLLFSGKIEDIKDLVVQAGQIVKVFINNDYVKKLEDKNIILVDMPGIDSGLEEHQKAIMNYISEGTAFIIVNDIEQGTLRSSTLSFIREISQYNLQSAVMISKGDKKSAEDVSLVREHIESQVKSYLQNNVEVGVTSSAKNEVTAINKFIDSINAVSLIEDKVEQKVKMFISGIITDLNVIRSASSIEAKDFEVKIQALEDEKNKISITIQEQQNKLPNIDTETEIIVEKVKEVLLANEDNIINLIKNNTDTNQLNSEILSIIRPVIIESIQSQNIELTEGLSRVGMQFNLDIQNILNEDSKPNEVNSDILNGVNQIVMIGSAFVGSKITKLLINNGLLKVASLASRVINPIVALIGPTIFSWFTKDSQEEAQSKLAAKFNNIKVLFKTKFINVIANDMAPNIKKALTEQRAVQIDELKHQMEQAIIKVQNSINEVTVKGRNKAEFDQYLVDVVNAKNELEQYLSN